MTVQTARQVSDSIVHLKNSKATVDGQSDAWGTQELGKARAMPTDDF